MLRQRYKWTVLFSLWAMLLIAFTDLVTGGRATTNRIQRSEPSIRAFRRCPKLVFTHPVTGEVRTVDIRSPYLYIGAGPRLHILEVVTTSTPITTVGISSPVSDDIQAVTLAGPYLYAAAGTGGLYIFDVQDPARPGVVGHLHTPGTAYDVVVSGTYAYVADGEAGLQIVDVSQAMTPTVIGHMDTAGTAYGVVVSGTHAFVADGEAGLQIVDVSQAMTPTAVYTLDTPGRAYDVAVSGTYAYVADGEAGLQIVDVSQAMTPTAVYTLDTPGTAYDVAVSGTYAYVADGEAGLQIVDVSQVLTPTAVYTLDTAGISYDVAVRGKSVYLADGSGGLVGVMIRPCWTALLPIMDKYWGPGLLFFDGFSNTSSGWPIYHWKDNIDWRYVDGTYEIRLLAPYRTARADAPYRVPADQPYRLEVDAQAALTDAVPSMYGLLFDGDVNGNFYTFLVNPQRQTFLVWQWAGAWKVILEEQPADVMSGPRQRYRLAVERKGDAVSLFINNTRVKQVNGLQRPSSLEAGVGLLAVSGPDAPAAVRFDNFAVWKR